MMSLNNEMQAVLNLLGKESLTVYDAGRIIEASGKAMQAMEKSILIELDYLQNSAREAVKMARSIMNQIAPIQLEIEECGQKACDDADEAYRKIRNARAKLAENIKRLPKLPEVDSTYNLKQMLEFVSEFRSLSDDQWKRLIDLAAAMQRKS